MAIFANFEFLALASILVSLGAFENEKWPPYTSHIAIELFKKDTASSSQAPIQYPSKEVGGQKSWFGRIFDSKKNNTLADSSKGIGRKKTDVLTEAEKQILDGHFVRLRYNDRVMNVPGCKAAGKHLEGDESFCTLVRLLTHSIQKTIY